MDLKDKIFITATILTSVALFAFVFWLGFPGYFQIADIYNSLDVNTNNWHPVFIARFIQGMYLLFGKHSFYLFALNLFCFYAGFIFFIIALYLKTRNVLAYALFGLTLIGNIFFQNFIEYHSFTLPMLLWLGCSMVFFRILIPVEPAFPDALMKILTGIVFMFSLLWRHNAIVSVYPLCMIFIYLYLKTKRIKNMKNYVVRFSTLMLVTAFVLIFIVKTYPYLLSHNLTHKSANHIFLHQIAGMTVPSNDASFIPRAWYAKNKSFQDVKKMYEKYPLYAAPFNVFWEPWGDNLPFKRDGLTGLKKLWFKAILKHPANYVKHVAGFYRAMWFQSPNLILNAEQIQKAPDNPWFNRVTSNFSKNERHIQFTPLQKRIYDFLFNHKILFNHIIGVAIGFIVLSASGYLWIFRPSLRSDLLFFAFASSLSTCCTANMVCIFSPGTDPRYMSPVLVLALISFIGFAGFSWLVILKNTGLRKS